MRNEVLLSTAARIISYATSFVSVPVLLKLLGTQNYGIWVTLTSFIVWILMFDLGVGNSLKNRIAECAACDELDKVQMEVLGLFKLFSYISMGLVFIFFVSFYFIPFFRDYAVFALIVYIPIMLFFPLSLGANILQGLRMVGMQSMLSIAPQLAFLMGLGLIWWMGFDLKLIYVACIFVFFNVLGSVLIFSYALKKINFRWQIFSEWSQCQIPIERISTSLSFFVLQITSLVLFNLGNYIVYNRLGAELVVKYDVLNKLFMSAIGVFNILIGVAWPEIVHQKTLKNYKRLYRIYGGLVGGSVVFSGLVFLSILFLPQFVDLWTHHKVNVTSQELTFFAFLVTMQALAYSGSVFLNAFEKIVPQISLGIFSILAMLPLCHMFFGLGYSVAAVPVVSGILLVPAALVCLMYALFLIRGVKLDAQKNIL